MQPPNNGAPPNAFTVAAGIIQFVPHVGQATAIALQTIGVIYQSNADCQALCDKLPEHLQHFTEKIRRVGKVTESKSRDDDWLLKYQQQFAARIQVIRDDLEKYQRARQSSRWGSGWLPSAKYNSKFRKHMEDMASINSRLDDAIKDFMLDCVVKVMERLDSFSAPSSHVHPQASLPTTAGNAKHVNEVMESTRLLMQEVDVNHDGYITVDELWRVQQPQGAILGKETLRKLITNVFDRNGDGKLDFAEATSLTAALHQLSRLFYAIPQRCQDSDYIAAATAVRTLNQAGYTSVTDADVGKVAKSKPQHFRWHRTAIGSELQVSYEGFLAFYFHAIDRHNLWHVLRNRIGMD